jgi:hypothetical protein
MRQLHPMDNREWRVENGGNSSVLLDALLFHSNDQGLKVNSLCYENSFPPSVLSFFYRDRKEMSIVCFQKLLC